MSEKQKVENLLSKAQKPAKLSPAYHKFYGGKVQVMPKCTIRDISDFALWYTPGVAAPCREIKENPELVFSYTNRWNYVAIVSDGSRVLGLGNIGAKAGLPVIRFHNLRHTYASLLIEQGENIKYIQT